MPPGPDPDPRSDPDPDPDRGGADSPVFAALASPARRRLLGLLLEHGPLPVQDLAAHFAMRRPSVSEHLRVLKDAGLVSERRAGRHRYYHLEPQPLQQLSQWLSPYEHTFTFRTEPRPGPDGVDEPRPYGGVS